MEASVDITSLADRRRYAEMGHLQICGQQKLPEMTHIAIENGDL